MASSTGLTPRRSGDSSYGTTRSPTSDLERNDANEQFQTKTSLAEKHLSTFKCTFCSRTFTRYNSLRRHLREHSDVHPFNCVVCGHRFSSSGDRKRHERLHFRQKEFMCCGTTSDGNQWGCGRGFRRLTTLAGHFCGERGRLCIAPLWQEEEEALVNQIQQTEANIDNHSPDRTFSSPKTSAIDGFSTSTAWPATLLQQYPDLATLSFIINKYDEAKISGRRSLDASSTKHSEDGVRQMDLSTSTFCHTMESASLNRDPDASYSLSVAAQGGYPPTDIAPPSWYVLASMENQEDRGSFGLEQSTQSLEAEHSHPDLDDWEHTPFNLQRVQPRSPQHAREDIPSEDYQQPHNSPDEGAFITPQAINAATEQTVHASTSKDLKLRFLEKEQHQETSTSLTDKESSMPGSIEEIKAVLSEPVYHHRTQQVPLDDSDSVVYDTATPGSAYSVMTSSSDTDNISSDSENDYRNSALCGTLDGNIQNSLIFPILDPAKRELVERVMIEFHSMMDQNIGLTSRGNSAGSQKSGASNASGLLGNSSEPSRKKRKFEDEEYEGPPNNGGGDGSNNTPRASDKEDTVNSRFACPYFKHDWQRHRKYRSCAGPGWDTVHRVKEHLYRRHALPIQCARCWRQFKNESELKQHHRALERCEIQNEEPPEGFDKEQEKLLKSRKKPNSDQGEEGKWKQVYRILFPSEDESLMPSPYYENEETLGDARWKRHRSDEFAQYEDFLGRELPRLVRRELEARVSQASGALVDQLNSQLVEIVRNCQAQLFRSYQQSHYAIESTVEGDRTCTTTQESQRASTNVVQVSAIIDDGLAAFSAPSPLPENGLVPSLEATTGSLERHLPEQYRCRSRGLDSGYDSNHSNHLSFPQNLGTSSTGGSSNYNEQAGVTTHVQVPQSFVDSHSHENSGNTFKPFQTEDIPWDNFQWDASMEHFLNDSPLDSFNLVEGASIDDGEHLTTTDRGEEPFGKTN